jgi:hypothetical protein
MRAFAVKIIIFFLLFLTSGNLFSQTPLQINAPINSFRINRGDLSRTGSNTDAYLFIGSIVVLTLTPTVVYGDKKFYFGLGRELSLAFGKRGEFRLSGEYTYVFRDNLKSQIRVAAKYDILSKLRHGEWIDEREFISIGAGYYTDTKNSGIAPEVSAGFRIGGDSSLLLYPYLKLRHTFMLKKDIPDNTDFSLGLAIGFKPF